MNAPGVVILAAGGSVRLGTPKQLLQFEGRSLVQRTVDAAAGFSPVIVVTGRDHEKVSDHLAEHDVLLVKNEDWSRGIGSSIKCGLRLALEHSPSLSAVVMLVCDQPYLTVEILRGLQAAYRATGKSIISCTYADGPGVPVLFDRTVFSRLLALPDDQGAKSILLQSPAEVATIEFPKGVVDIDTPDDSRALERGTL